MTAEPVFRLLAILALFSAALVGCFDSPSNKSPHNKSENTDNPSISVIVGPTAIPRGDATGAADFTVRNEFFALAFAVETASPWGVAKGGILDISIVKDGALGSDFVSLVDFMPNYWSAWPTTYQRVELEQNTPETVVVSTVRDWGEVELQTRFEIEARSKLVKITTQMTNQGAAVLNNLTSGYIAWPNGGHLFGMPGLTEGDSIPVSEAPALAKWSASYDQGWALGLYTPFSELVAYTGRDRYLRHNLEPGAVAEFEAWLQIEDSADLSRLVHGEIKGNSIPAGKVTGRIANTKGEVIDGAAAVIHRDGRLYAWALAVDGIFETHLPVGEYQIYPAAPGYAPGSLRSINLVQGELIELDLTDIQAPGTVKFSVVDKNRQTPLDAMISVTEGTKPVIQYFGKSRFFTELDGSGSVALSIPPGDYSFDVSAAGGFTSRVQSIKAVVESGQSLDVLSEIDVLAYPAQQQWYNADLHHHSDVLDGFTEPEFVFRSELAAGVDVAFLSDHDSVVNNAQMKQLADQRDMAFIGGTELSASWAHFNAYPIDVDKVVNPDVGLMPVQGIFKEARRLGAEIIHVNHPYGNYGYFRNLERGEADGVESVPGGYDTGFDLIEITGDHLTSTLNRAWQSWNEGKPAYFAAGSDVHDVWGVAPEYASGSARSYVHVPGELTERNYIAGLKAGSSYASQGPLIYPELMFGSKIEQKAGRELMLSYKVQAVSGLHSVQLIERGEQNQIVFFDDENPLPIGPKDVAFNVIPATDTWYSLVVADSAGNYAYSNPLWVTVTNK